jgi:hypothetical protein
MCIERDKALYARGQEAIKAEARRLNDLAARGLHGAGLKPEQFGVSLPGMPGPTGDSPRKNEF